MKNLEILALNCGATINPSPASGVFDRLQFSPDSWSMFAAHLQKDVPLILKYLEEYRENLAFQRDACYHPGVVSLQTKVVNLDALIARLKND